LFAILHDTGEDDELIVVVVAMEDDEELVVLVIVVKDEVIIVVLVSEETDEEAELPAKLDAGFPLFLEKEADVNEEVPAGGGRNLGGALLMYPPATADAIMSTPMIPITSTVLLGAKR
jgi:hypothetical protein